MRVELSETARRDLVEIQEHLIDKFPGYLERTLRGFNESFRLLARFPELGRPGTRDGIREFSVAKLPYVIVYAVQGDVVQVQNVRHTAKRWPPLLYDE